MKDKIDHENFGKLCCEQRKRLGGGILQVLPKEPILTEQDLSTAYTPGVAEPCLRIARHPEDAYRLTFKANSVAVISDGTAVLGLGNIGPAAALPVMEGKAVLFKTFANIDAVPLVLDTTDVDELERTVRLLSPTFGGINLEDISAPRCVELVERLQDLPIPVFHDDQDGTAIVTLAALHNALRLTRKHMPELKVVINGAGAAGYAIAKMLTRQFEPPREVIVCDSKGILTGDRANVYHKKAILEMPNVRSEKGDLNDAMAEADVFIGVSKGNVVSKDMVRRMNREPILFALANPQPEILPDDAFAAGAAIVGTGRSDYPNQINNVLAFPGLFRGALDIRAHSITPEMMLAAARTLAGLVIRPNRNEILPKTMGRPIAKAVAAAVAEEWLKSGTE